MKDIHCRELLVVHIISIYSESVCKYFRLLSSSSNSWTKLDSQVLKYCRYKLTFSSICGLSQSTCPPVKTKLVTAACRGKREKHKAIRGYTESVYIPPSRFENGLKGEPNRTEKRITKTPREWQPLSWSSDGWWSKIHLSPTVKTEPTITVILDALQQEDFARKPYIHSYYIHAVLLFSPNTFATPPPLHHAASQLTRRCTKLYSRFFGQMTRHFIDIREAATRVTRQKGFPLYEYILFFCSTILYVPYV